MHLCMHLCTYIDAQKMHLCFTQMHPECICVSYIDAQVHLCNLHRCIRVDTGFHLVEREQETVGASRFRRLFFSDSILRPSSRKLLIMPGKGLPNICCSLECHRDCFWPGCYHNCGCPLESLSREAVPIPMHALLSVISFSV